MHQRLRITHVPPSGPRTNPTVDLGGASITLMVARLPVEALVLIFDRATADLPRESEKASLKSLSEWSPLNPLAISHVCRHWRAVSLAAPCLWSKLLLGQDPLPVATLLQRSKGASLSVASPSQSTLGQLSAVLTHHSTRIRELDVTARDAHFLSLPFPRLTTLALEFPYTEDVQCERSDRWRNLIHSKRGCCDLPQLTHLRLSDPKGRLSRTTATAALHHILRKSPNLEVLVLELFDLGEDEDARRYVYDDDDDDGDGDDAEDEDEDEDEPDDHSPALSRVSLPQLRYLHMDGMAFECAQPLFSFLDGVSRSLVIRLSHMPCDILELEPSSRTLSPFSIMDDFIRLDLIQEPNDVLLWLVGVGEQGGLWMDGCENWQDWGPIINNIHDLLPLSMLRRLQITLSDWGTLTGVLEHLPTLAHLGVIHYPRVPSRVEDRATMIEATHTALLQDPPFCAPSLESLDICGGDPFSPEHVRLITRMVEGRASYRALQTLTIDTDKPGPPQLSEQDLETLGKHVGTLRVVTEGGHSRYWPVDERWCTDDMPWTPSGRQVDIAHRSPWLK